jgi:hypothetical protein
LKSVRFKGPWLLLHRTNPSVVHVLRLDSLDDRARNQMLAWSITAADPNRTAPVGLPWAPPSEGPFVRAQAPTQARTVLAALLISRPILVMSALAGAIALESTLPGPAGSTSLRIGWAAAGLALLLLTATTVVRSLNLIMRSSEGITHWLAEPLTLASTTMVGPLRLPWQSLSVLRLRPGYLAAYSKKHSLVAVIPSDCLTSDDVAKITSWASGAGVKVRGHLSAAAPKRA